LISAGTSSRKLYNLLRAKSLSQQPFCRTGT
jgi:hypothetical protein